MDIVAWILAIALMAVGLAGTLLPVLPGTGLILCAILLHRFWFGADGVGWVAISVAAVLFLLSLAVDFLAGVTGAKISGASKAGLWGGLAGMIVGLFFGLPGILLGPLLGVLAGELLVGRRWAEAGRSSVGTVLGNLAGGLAKLALGLAMVGAFVAGVWK
jgi:uncharacterized protein YqgC (DUF456 family)